MEYIKEREDIHWILFSCLILEASYRLQRHRRRRDVLLICNKCTQSSRELAHTLTHTQGNWPSGKLGSLKDPKPTFIELVTAGLSRVLMTHDNLLKRSSRMNELLHHLHFRCGGGAVRRELRRVTRRLQQPLHKRRGSTFAHKRGRAPFMHQHEPVGFGWGQMDRSQAATPQEVKKKIKRKKKSCGKFLRRQPSRPEWLLKSETSVQKNRVRTSRFCLSGKEKLHKH